MPTALGAVPNPDPTQRTIEQAQRETLNLRELLESRIDATDRHANSIGTLVEKVPGLIVEAIKHLRELNEERFASIQTQFKERDTRTEQISLANKLAIDAALQAAKEAVGEQNKSNLLANAKSEAAFTKQMDLLTDTMKTMKTGIDDKMDDLKERIVAQESRRTGAVEEKKHSLDLSNYIVGFIALVVAIVALFWRHT